MEKYIVVGAFDPQSGHYLWQGTRCSDGRTGMKRGLFPAEIISIFRSRGWSLWPQKPARNGLIQLVFTKSV